MTIERTQLVARCVEPGCKCDHRSGVVCRDQDEADYYASRGYEVREEIRGGLFAGMTPTEVLADRDRFRRMIPSEE